MKDVTADIENLSVNGQQYRKTYSRDPYPISKYRLVDHTGPTRIIPVNSSNIETCPGGGLTPKNQQVEHFARQSKYNKGLEMIAEDKNPGYSYRFAKATGKGEGLDSIAN